MASREYGMSGMIMGLILKKWLSFTCSCLWCFRATNAFDWESQDGTGKLKLWSKRICHWQVLLGRILHQPWRSEKVCIKLTCVSILVLMWDHMIGRALDSRYLQEVVKAASGKPYDEKIASGYLSIMFHALHLQCNYSGNGCLQDFRFYLC